MGEYRFSIYLKWQLGFNLLFDSQIVLTIPFMDLRFAISKDAHGFGIFFKR